MALRAFVVAGHDGDSAMKLWLRIVFLACLLGAIASAPVRVQMTDEPDVPTLTPLVLGYQTTLRSEALGEDRLVFIYLPPSYAVSQAAYPVLYLLDGRSSFQHASSSSSVLSMVGLIPEQIVVGVANIDRTRDFTSVPREGGTNGGADRFLEFLDSELVPFVDGTFRTRPHRTLVGHSLGALPALQAMVERPELFQAFLLVSPAISADERDLPSGVEPLTGRVEKALRARQVFNRFVYITMSSNEDPLWVDDATELQRVFRKHAPKGFVWKSRDMPGETHATNPVKSVFDGLRLLFDGWDGAESMASGSADRIDAHFMALSERFGYEVAPPESVVNVQGYRLLQQGRIAEAIGLFELNVRYHVGSANAYDSLGEALENSGDLEAALANYRRAAELGAAGAHPDTATFQANQDRVRTIMESRSN